MTIYGDRNDWLESVVPCRNYKQTEKSFPILIKSNRNQIVFSMHQLIWNQKDVRLGRQNIGHLIGQKKTILPLWGFGNAEIETAKIECSLLTATYEYKFNLNEKKYILHGCSGSFLHFCFENNKQMH